MKPTYQELEKIIETYRTTDVLIEKSPIIRFVWKNEENWPVEFVSDNVKNLFGYIAEDFLSGKIVYSKIIHTDDLPRVGNEVAENSKPTINSFTHKPYRIIAKTGIIKWVSDITLIRRNKNEEITHYEGVIIDITEQKEAEQNIQTQNEEYAALNEEFKTQNEELKITKDTAEKSEKKYKKLSNLTFEGVLLHEKGIAIDINLSFAKLFGYTHEELLGKNIIKLLIPKKHHNIIYENIKKEYANPYEIEGIRKDGSIFPIELEARNIESDIKNRTIRVVAVRNISKRKIAEKELIIAKDRAEESDQLKTEFIHNMSHEIRTPLNGILGFSSILENPNLSDKKRKQYIKIIHNSGNQLMRIIDDILEISRLETKQIKVMEEQICLNDLLLELFSIFDIKAKENQIPLYFKKELSDIESTILTDDTKLRKILNNLLENALKFTNEGFIEFGYTLIGADAPDGSSLQQTNTFIQIYVKDTGIGVKSDKQEIIFERFSQEEKEISQKAGGLGLGLSIAKENAELLGGKITLQSEKGKGTTFFVTIPYKPVQEAINTMTLNQSITEKKQDNCTILIVEDEEINFLYLDTLLEIHDSNLKSLHARNGQEAVKICQENSKIDIVLMDLKMPIMNGFEATKQIKEISPDLPIIAQTAYSTKEEKEQAFLAGCDDFISKPIKKRILFDIIDKYLTMKQ
jgi:PAS domain S-box-containing protein